MRIAAIVRKVLGFAFISMMTVVLSACGAPALDDNDNGAEEEQPRYYSGHRAAFMGDSITQMWNEDQYGHPNFFLKNDYLCKGISGQTTTQMIERFKRDILDDDPGCVVICAGTNDLAGNGGTPLTPEEVLDNLIVMVEMAVRMDMPVIMCSLLPASRYYWNPSIQPAETIVTLNAMIKEYAEANGHTYVDYWTPMANENKGLPSKYSSDGVHPTKAGYRVMEGIIKPAIDSVLD